MGTEGARLGHALAGKGNALNVVRLVFAVLVIVSHSWLLTGRTEPAFAGLTLGGWGVMGFFAISGYLIPRARVRTDLATFLVRRGRRIYPGFWVCSAVVAFAVTPTIALLTDGSYDVVAAARYVFLNGTIFIFQPIIGAGGASPTALTNAPTWTLAFELMCYGLAGALLTLDVVRRHATTVAVVLYVGAALTVLTTGLIGAPWFIAQFAAGWIISTLGHRLTATPAMTGAAVGVAAVLGLAVHPVLAAVPLAYAILSAGALLPIRWFTTHDASYGTYLYSWPIQKLLLALGIESLGVFVPLALVLSVTAGAASWFLVERRFVHRVVVGLGGRDAGAGASLVAPLARQLRRPSRASGALDEGRVLAGSSPRSSGLG